MNIRLFLSTFVLIFLAELGDKTQLAAMARSATGDKYTVFLAASAALVASTLIAVFFGATLTRLVSEQTLRIASGLLFLLFGALILYSTLLRPVPSSPAATVIRPGVLARIALEAAVRFEEAAWRDYSQLADQGNISPALRELWQGLALAEQQHINMLRGLLAEQGESAPFAREAADLPSHAELHHDVAAAGTEAAHHLEHAREHEEATARFYEELARVTHLASLQALFIALAREERHHAETLAAFGAG